MKYCLSGRQPDQLLKKADEIKIALRDFRAIPEFLEKFPEKSLILEMENNIPEDFNWDTIKTYDEISNGNIYCAISNINQMPECKLRDIKFYYKYAITSFYELNALKQMGVSYVLISAPLVFDLKNVSKYKIPIRVIPNLAYEPYLQRKEGVCGGWIRPEDIDKYGEYVNTCEFYSNELKKEAALYHVYVENKKWPGNLNLLIDNLNFDFNNNILYDAENFAERRMNCKQKCMSGSACNYCYNQLNSEQLIRKYLDYKNNIDFL